MIASIFLTATLSVIEPLPGERWHGGTTFYGEEQPYATTPARDMANHSHCNPCAPLFVSTAGRYVWSDRPFTYAFTNDVLYVSSEVEKVEPVAAGRTLRRRSSVCVISVAAVPSHLPLLVTERRKRKSIALGKFPNILRTNINLVRPHESAIADEHLPEEILVVESLPVGLVEIARTVENAALAGVELDIDLVAVKRLCSDNIVYHLHP